MFKHLLAIILISILVIMGMPYAAKGLHVLLAVHNWIGDALKQVFTGGEVGDITRQLIALLCVPFLVGLLPALVTWLTRRRWMDCFMELVWVVWLVQTAALIAVWSAPLVK